MKEIFTGLRYAFSSFGYIRCNGLRYVYLISLALIILYTIANVGVTDVVSTYIRSLVDMWLATMSLPDWLNTAISMTANIMTSVICFFAIATIGGSVIIILLSPLFSHIAEKVNTQLTGKSTPFKFKVFLYQIWRGIGISLRNILIQYAIIIALFILSFFPAIGWVCNVAIFFVNAFFYGFTLTDYAFEAKMLSIRQSTSFAHANKLTLIGLGLPFAMCMFIPVIGSYIAAFVVPATVVGGMRMLCERE
jgi:CysZ protein